MGVLKWFIFISIVIVVQSKHLIKHFLQGSHLKCITNIVRNGVILINIEVKFRTSTIQQLGTINPNIFSIFGETSF